MITCTNESPKLTLQSRRSGIPPSPGKHAYTVPAIHHRPTDTHLMDSLAIAPFLERTYPARPVALSSEPADLLEAQARDVLGRAVFVSIAPRELHVLSARAQEYFRRTREAALGVPLESLLEREAETWAAVEERAREVGELMLARRAEGPFVLGREPSMADFFVAGALQSARVVSEGVWERVVGFPGYGEVYEACREWMERDD